MQHWFQKFRCGKANIEGKKGREKLKTLMVENSYTNVRELASEISESIGSISESLKKMGKSKQLDTN